VLQIGAYQRVNAYVRCGEENFFDAGWQGRTNGTTTSYQHQVLEIHHPAGVGDTLIDVRLISNHKKMFGEIVFTEAPLIKTLL
jgi:hypothetical protein